MYLIGLDYKTIYIDGVLTGANDLVIGQGVDFLIGKMVRYVEICLNRILKKLELCLNVIWTSFYSKQNVNIIKHMSSVFLCWFLCSLGRTVRTYHCIQHAYVTLRLKCNPGFDWMNSNVCNECKHIYTATIMYTRFKWADANPSGLCMKLLDILTKLYINLS